MAPEVASTTMWWRPGIWSPNPSALASRVRSVHAAIDANPSTSMHGLTHARLIFLCMQPLRRPRARGCRCTVRSAPARRPPSPSLLEMLRWDQVRTDYYVRRKASRGAEDVLNPAKLHVLMTQVDFGTSSTFGIGSGFGSSAWIDADGDPTIVSQQRADHGHRHDRGRTMDPVRPLPQPPVLPAADPLVRPQHIEHRGGSPACRSLGSYGNGCSKPPTRPRTPTAGTRSSTATTGRPPGHTCLIRWPSAAAPPSTTSGSGAATPCAASSVTWPPGHALGGRAQSLLAQTARSLGNAFSYCVPQASASRASSRSVGGRPQTPPPCSPPRRGSGAPSTRACTWCGPTAPEHRHGGVPVGRLYLVTVHVWFCYLASELKSHASRAWPLYLVLVS